ncbi:MAG TPA: Crp/Fnr family transcriptional regulator [Casimicrobiaceae bacterium]|jgi:CRP-like cAMP-binding protein|nr:Crp/Fnr family transcriptional regulator [Casimicrobiaceae bacterium]
MATRNDLPHKREGAKSNRLLAALPSRDRARLMSNCEQIDLAMGEVLGEPGSTIRHAYFPLASFISLITPADGNASLEVGMVGNEGMHGVTLALGVDSSPLHSLVQGGGPCLRMSATAFRLEQARSVALQKQLNRYLYVLTSQLAQSAVCARFHLIEARLARWLLMTRDRAQADCFHITHQFLAWMLGVRRVGVTNAAGELQRKKLISYVRGQVTVLNRSGLEQASCSCYRADKAVYDRFLG